MKDKDGIDERNTSNIGRHSLKVEDEAPVVVQNGIDVIHNGVAMLAVTED